MIDGEPVLWVPQSRPQWLALLSRADELFYGGQAGGGKTDLLLGLSMCLHRNSIIFRREYAQMTGADGIIARSSEIAAGTGSYNGQEHIWKDLPGDRRLEFAGMPHEKDKKRFQGRPHDLKAYDELPEIPESAYLFTIAWNRTTIPGQRTRIVSGGNPPTTSDGLWVVKRWGPWLDNTHSNPALPGEMRWFAMLDGKDTEVESGAQFEYKGETITPKSRTFIPASLADNVFLNEEYRAQLQALPEPLRSKLLYGDFSVSADDDAWQVIPTQWIIDAQNRWTPDGNDGQTLDALGCDASRGGKDEFVDAKRYGVWFSLHPHKATDANDGEQGAALIAKDTIGDDMSKAIINIDVIGVGTAVYDFAKRMFERVNGVNAAEGTNATDVTRKLKMANVRAEYHWRMREALDPSNGNNVALPPDPQLRSDLAAPRYEITLRGVQIEPKEKIKERLGRSPDRGEAVMLANYTGRSWSWLV